MNLTPATLSVGSSAQFGFTLRDVALCSIPVIALGVSILTLL
jgi:hypothetical protein